MADATDAPAEGTPTPEEAAFEAGLTGTEPAETTETEPEGEPEKGAEGEEAPAEGEEPEAGKDGEESETDGDETEESDKTDPKEVNRRGYAERRAMRETVTATIDKMAKPQTAEQLVESNGLDPAEAKVEALRQEMQRKEAIAEVTELNNGLRSDAERVVEKFSVFDQKSPDYDEAFANEVDELYREAADYRTDESGEVVLQARVPLYKFYAAMANARSKGVAIGEAKGQKAAETMLASAETPAAPKPTAKSSGDGMSDDDAAFLRGLTGKSAS